MMSQPLAYLDPSFLESEEARPIRILAEYLEPLRRFRQEQIQDTVVFFGSARIHSRELDEESRQLARLHARWAKSLEGPNHRFVVCSGGGPGIMEAVNHGATEVGAKS